MSHSKRTTPRAHPAAGQIVSRTVTEVSTWYRQLTHKPFPFPLSIISLYSLCYVGGPTSSFYHNDGLAVTHHG